jgi:hypothetical protein
LPVPTQIPNLARACGFAGNNNTLQLQFDFQSQDWGASGYTTTVSLANTQYATITLTNVATANTPATASAQNGATISTTNIPDYVWVTLVVTIPCTNLIAETPYTLLFNYNGPDDYGVDNVAINTCNNVETCGGQGMVCPGLKRFQPCTPGMVKSFSCHVWFSGAPSSSTGNCQNVLLDIR